MRTRLFKGYQKEYIFKITKQKSIMFLSCSSWESNKDMILNTFPGQSLRSAIHYEHAIQYLYEMKALIILYLPHIFICF